MPNPDHPFFQLRDTCSRYGATLVAVSKTRTIPETNVLYQMGQRLFAENRAQELLLKAPVMPPDIEWHLIGHLQTNKVRSVVPYISCIQSLDRISLWEKIQEEAMRIDKRITCLLQIKVAMEETKYGWELEELYQLLASGQQNQYPNVIIGGVMGMASFTDDTEQVRREMKQIKASFDKMRHEYFADSMTFQTISMGMSGDYLIALEEGSNMIRVGSLLFPSSDH